jgi:hypothetical protein
MPPVLPPFAGIDIGWDGTIWLRRNLLGPVPAVYSVFASSGEPLGTVQLPRAGLSLRAATLSAFWAVETDDDGFLQVVRYRVESR